MGTNNYFKTWMRSLFLVLFMTCCMSSFAQTVTITCTGASGSFNSGSVNATGTKNDGNMVTINTTTNRGWAHYDLSSIPPSAIVSAVTANFTTFTSTSSTALNNLYGFTGNPSAIAGATLYTNCGSGSTFNNTAWTANAANSKALNAAGIAFIQTNVGTNNANIGYVRASTNTYNIYGYSGVTPPTLVITYSVPSPCSSIPAPGNTTLTAGTNPACAGVPITLGLQNSTSGSGVTYQWQSDTGSGFSNISGATSSTYSVSQSVPTSYQCIVTCSAFPGNPVTSNPLAVGQNAPTACYCTPTTGGGTTYYISNFITTGGTSNLNNTSAGSTTGYQDFSGTASMSVVHNQVINYTMTVAGANTYGRAIWIDYNQNGSFGAGEQVVSSAAYVASPLTGSFTVSPTALTGNTRMRIVATFTPNNPSDPCVNAGTGEYEDYTINISALNACSGTPAPGNTISSVASVCSGVSFNLSLQNTITGSGITYLWQSSPDGSTWSNISGATNSTYSATQTAATYYQCVVTCSSGPSSGTSNPVQVGLTTGVACLAYCTSVPTNTADEEIYSITVNGASTPAAYANASGCTTPAPGTGSLVNRYSNFFPLGSLTTIAPGQTVSFTVEENECDGATFYAFGTSIWIDWNQNGSWTDAGEQVFVEASTLTGPRNVTGSFTVPLTAVAGQTGMRIIVAEGVSGAGLVPCLSYSYGETEDWLLNIVALPATPPNPIEVGTPNCATGGNLQATGSAPSGETWYWQTSASGTSTAQPVSGLYNILSNGTYYIRSQNNTYLTWSAGAGSITVTDFPTGPADPTISTPGGNPACGSVSLVSSVATAGSTNYWQGTNATGTSTALVAHDGTTSTPYLVTSSGTYYLRGRDNTSFCWSNSVAVSATVNAIPTAPILGASPGTVCPGSATALSAVAPSAPPTGYSVASTSFSNLPSPIATTLANAGPTGDEGTVVANIGFSFNYFGTAYTQVQVHTNGYIVFGSSNYTFGSYSPVAIPNVANTNNWVGFWADLNASAGQISYATLGSAPSRMFVVNYNNVPYFSATPYYSGQIVVYEATGAIDVFLGHTQTTNTNACGLENLGGTAGIAAPGRDAGSWAVDNEAWKFSPIQAMGFLWSANTAANGGIPSGNETLANTVAYPTSTTIYTMTLTEPSNGCQNSSSITVNVAPTPPAPTGTGGATTCGAGTVTVSATGTGGALNWFDAASGGNSLGANTSSISVSVVSADVTVWVEESNGTCSGPRTAVTAVYTAAPTVTASSDVSFVCFGGPNNTAILSSTDGGGQYTSFTWMPGSLSGQSVSVTPSMTTTYTVTASGGGCSYVASVTVNAGAVPTINSVTATPATVCQGNTSQLIAAVQGGSGGSEPSGYCAATNAGSSCISNVTLNTLNSTVATPCGNSGTSYYTYNAPTGSNTTSLVLGNTYSVSVTCNGTAITSVWIDFNRDGVLSASEWVQPYTAAATGSINITVPLTASPGQTRMRVRSRLNGNPNGSGDACLAMGSGSTEDYTVTINGGGGYNYSWTPSASLSDATIFNPVATLGAPSTTYNVSVSDAYGCTSTGSVTLSEPSSNPGNTQSTASPVCATQSFTLSVQNPGSGANYQWQSSPDGSTWTNISGATNATYSTTQSVATYYRCSVGCLSGGSTSNPLLVAQNSFLNCYCASGATITADEEIYDITVNGASTPAAYAGTNGCTTAAPGTGSILNRYSNFVPLGALTTMIPGNTVSFDINEDECDGATYFAFGTAIWIDYNQNGSFSDPGEQVFVEAATATGPRHVTGSFTIPGTATPGQTLMRITVAEGISGTGLTPCLSYGYGETEDWVVNIGAPSVTSNTPVCEGDSLKLFATPSGATSYAWTGPNGFISTDQNPFIANASPLASGTYNCDITISGNTFPVTTSVVVNPKPTLSIDPVTSFCEYTADLNLSATTSGTIFSWTGPGGYTSAVQNPTRITPPAAYSGLYSLEVTDGNSCKNTQSVSVTIYASPVVDITVIGSSNLCTGQTTAELQGGGAVSYEWSTLETTNSIVVSSAGVYNVTGTDANGCQNDTTQTITETAAPAAPNVTPAGPVTLCTDGSTSTSITLTATNYPGPGLSWSDGSTDVNSISINYADNIFALYVDGNGCVSSSNIVVVDQRLYSIAASGVSGDTALCSGNSVTLSVAGGNLELGDTWQWYRTGCGSVSVGSGTSITVSPTTTTQYFVRAEGSCGSTACANRNLLVFSSGPLGNVQNVVLPAAACVGNTISASVPVIPGATYYQWSAPAGSLINGNPSPYTTSSNAVTITLGNAVSSGWYICVQGGNPCNTTINTKCNWIRGSVTQPLSISGNIVACPNTSGSYSTPAVTGAETYAWSITGDATVSGSGTTVTVNFGPSFTSGTLCVRAALNCGYQSAPRCIAISNTTPVPGAMTGPSTVCPGGSGSYSIPSIAVASGYNWTVPTGATITSGIGTNSVTVMFPSGYTTGTVCVTANSSCGVPSVSRCKTVVSGIPGVPASISGQLTGVCGSTQNYSAASVAGATGYSWSVVGGTISGPSTNSTVVVDWSASGTTGTLSVAATNSCGAGGLRTVSIRKIPGVPGAITGDASVTNCGVGNYSLVAVAGATSYNWAAPVVPANIIGNGSNSVTIDYSGVAPGSYSITATPANACGNSNTVSFSVTIGGCARQMQQAVINAGFELNAYPNPAHDKFIVETSSEVENNYVLSITDLSGRVIAQLNGKVVKGINKIEVDATSFAKGMYLVSLQTSDNKGVVNMVIE